MNVAALLDSPSDEQRRKVRSQSGAATPNEGLTPGPATDSPQLQHQQPARAGEYIAQRTAGYGVVPEQSSSRRHSGRAMMPPPAASKSTPLFPTTVVPTRPGYSEPSSVYARPPQQQPYYSPGPQVAGSPFAPPGPGFVGGQFASRRPTGRDSPAMASLPPRNNNNTDSSARPSTGPSTRPSSRTSLPSLSGSAGLPPLASSTPVLAGSSSGSNLASNGLSQSTSTSSHSSSMWQSSGGHGHSTRAGSDGVGMPGVNATKTVDKDRITKPIHDNDRSARDPSLNNSSSLPPSHSTTLPMHHHTQQSQQQQPQHNPQYGPGMEWHQGPVGLGIRQDTQKHHTRRESATSRDGNVQQQHPAQQQPQHPQAHAHNLGGPSAHPRRPSTTNKEPMPIYPSHVSAPLPQRRPQEDYPSRQPEHLTPSDFSRPRELDRRVRSPEGASKSRAVRPYPVFGGPPVGLAQPSVFAPIAPSFATPFGSVTTQSQGPTPLFNSTPQPPFNSAPPAHPHGPPFSTKPLPDRSVYDQHEQGTAKFDKEQRRFKQQAAAREEEQRQRLEEQARMHEQQRAREERTSHEARLHAHELRMREEEAKEMRNREEEMVRLREEEDEERRREEEEEERRPTLKLHLGTFVFPRTPFPYLFPVIHHHPVDENTDPNASSSSLAIETETRTTLIVPNGHIPLAKPSHPKIWGGGVAKFAHNHPYARRKQRRIYTDDSDILLCAIHAGHLTWSGARSAKLSGKDIRVDLRVVRASTVVGGHGTGKLGFGGIGQSGGKFSVGSGQEGVGMFVGGRGESFAGTIDVDALPDEDDGVPDDGRGIVSAGWGSGHDGSGVEIMGIVFLEKGASKVLPGLGIRNRSQRLAEYAARRSDMFGLPVSQGKKRRRLSPPSALCAEAEEKRAVMFGLGSMGDVLPGYKYQPDVLRDLLFPARPNKRRKLVTDEGGGDSEDLVLETIKESFLLAREDEGRAYVLSLIVPAPVPLPLPPAPTSATISTPTSAAHSTSTTIIIPPTSASADTAALSPLDSDITMADSIPATPSTTATTTKLCITIPAQKPKPVSVPSPAALVSSPTPLAPIALPPCIPTPIPLPRARTLQVLQRGIREDELRFVEDGVCVLGDGDGWRIQVVRWRWSSSLGTTGTDVKVNC